MIDKVIVTNVSALRAKYGAKYAQVQAAARDLIAADKARGLTTRLVAIDSAAYMKRVHGTAVTNASDQRGAKAAVYVIHAFYWPYYILILGAPDGTQPIPLPLRNEQDRGRCIPPPLQWERPGEGTPHSRHPERP